MEWLAALIRDPSGRERRLIPVRILDMPLPGLLAAVSCIDIFHAGDEMEAREMLLTGIDPRSRIKPLTKPAFPPITDYSTLTPPRYPIPATNSGNSAKNNIEIEIVLNGSIEAFDHQQQEKFLRAIRELLSINNELKISSIRRGSIILTISMNYMKALKLATLFESGKLDYLGVRGFSMPDPAVRRRQEFRHLIEIAAHDGAEELDLNNWPP